MPKFLKGLLLWLGLSILLGLGTAWIWISVFKSLFDSGGLIFAMTSEAQWTVSIGMCVSFGIGGFLLFLTGFLFSKLSLQPVDMGQYRLLGIFGFIGAQLGVLLRGVAAAKFEVSAQLVETQHPIIYLDKLNLSIWTFAGFISGLVLAVGIAMAFAMMKTDPS